METEVLDVENEITADNVTVDSSSSEDMPDLSALIDVAMKAAPTILSSLGQGSDLSSLMSMLGGTNQNVGTSSTSENNSPIRSKSSEKTQLLRALKPYLKPQRASKIDRALSALETAYAAKTALNLFSAGNGKGN